MGTSRALVGMIAVLALSACGGGGGGSAVSTCSPSGQTLHVSAQNFAFDKSCYAVRAGKPFTIDFDNKDTAPHNFAIYVDSTSKKLCSKDDAGSVNCTGAAGGGTPAGSSGSLQWNSSGAFAGLCARKRKQCYPLRGRLTPTMQSRVMSEANCSSFSFPVPCGRMGIW